MWNEAIKEGSVAVITGGANGLGLAMAKQCAMRGLHVVLADTSEREMAKAARSLSGLGTDVQDGQNGCERCNRGAKPGRRRI